MLKLFNTLSRKKETFKSIKIGQVGLYICGPTVYNYAHIGNLRTYIFEDILRRTLESNGYKVKDVMNITDVDDKIIKAKIATAPFERAFFEDLKKLNIKKSWKYPKATEHVDEMIKLISILLKKKIAYIAKEGVYFDISKSKKYGKLSKISHLDVQRLSRISADEYDKANVQDFALWKFKKPNEPFWKAPFGNGRPGWHIECSAMSEKYLGQSFDIHAGGVDLIFPHHENEIAQSEAVTGKKFVKYWIHGEHLLVNGEKMSKSLKNIFTLCDIEKRNFNPLAYRYFVLGAHYRSKLNFTWEALEGAQKALERLYEEVRTLKNTKHKAQITKYKNQFKNAINNDLNTPQALAVLWKVAKLGNLPLLYEFDEILGLGFKNLKQISISISIRKLTEKREKFRKEKKWKEADEIREILKKSGYAVEDTAKGPRVFPLV